VSYREVAALAERMPGPPRVIALDPHTLGETLGDVRTLAEATGRRDVGVDLIARSAARIDRVKLAVRGAQRPRVAAIEWFDPIFVAGHWTPQLIELAGGEDVLGAVGEPSETSSWEALAACAPQIVLAMPCGYDAPRARTEALAHAPRLRALGAERVVAVDAAAYFSRPGPRLLDGLELLAHVLHPDRAPPAPAAGLEVALGAAG
jgi:iron complex transport system substrate-binding protein